MKTVVFALVIAAAFANVRRDTHSVLAEID
jgi:hypothetical protein